MKSLAISLVLVTVLAGAALADTCAPGKVTTPTVGTGKSTAVVEWTATGDDCATGNATTYEVRYATGNITDTNWQSATVGESGSSEANGNTQCADLSGLSCNTTYYFVVFLIDDAGNRSPLGTVVSATTKSCSSAEVLCP